MKSGHFTRGGNIPGNCPADLPAQKQGGLSTKNQGLSTICQQNVDKQFLDLCFFYGILAMMFSQYGE